MWAFIVSVVSSSVFTHFLAAALTGIAALIVGQHPNIAGILSAIADYFRSSEKTK